MGHVEERIAEFIVGTRASDVPQAALDAAQRSSLDCMGCMLAAATQPQGQAITRFAKAECAGGDASVIGSMVRAGRSTAALANGTLAHALDFDDGRTASGHAACTLLPTALAIAEPLRSPGVDLLTAYAIGLEVITHIADACDFEEKDSGFHRTSLFGTLGATAAAARLAGLDQRQTVMALGTAGSLACGVCQNFGTFSKPLHAGAACRAAVSAVLLAADGWTGSPDILGGPAGWTAAFVRRYDYDAMAKDLGAVWRTAERAPLIKKYPSCGLSHGPLESLLGLMDEHGFTAAEVLEVEATASYDSMVLLHPEPTSGYQGKFSLPYLLATALIDGRIDLDSFTDEKLARPQYPDAVGKLRINLTSKWNTPATKIQRRAKRDDAFPVIVRLADGRTLSRSTPRAAGLVTDEQVAAKFRANAARALPAADHVERALRLWRRLADLDDVTAAIGAVSGGAFAAP